MTKERNLYHQARAQFEIAHKLSGLLLADATLIENITRGAILMAESIKKGGKIMSCGNGGSMCDATHFAEELSGRYRENRPAIAAMALNDSAHLSCVANDYGFEEVFSRYVSALGRGGDVLLAISTSGRSENVLRALAEAKSKKIARVLLSSQRISNARMKKGQNLSEMAEIALLVPCEKDGYADRVQELHIQVLHVLIYLIEKELENS